MQMRRFLLVVGFAATFPFTPRPANAQANLPIYTDHIVNGFQDWSWAPRNWGSTAALHTGTNSIAVTPNNFGDGISFHQSAFNTSVYSALTFWANGGTNGGQTLDVYASLNDVDQSHYNLSPALPANAWQQYVIPLANLGAANKANLTKITIQLLGGNKTTFYLDDIQLTANPAPATVHISLNATQNLRSVDFRMFGLNTAIYDSNFDTSQTISLLKEMGAMILRFPGGSLSDEYHWHSNTTLSNTWTWATSFANFTHVATNVGTQAFITVNYGTGTPAEAGGWVRLSNVTNHLGFKYWEVGNENYGTWETDWNTNAPYRANDGWTYAMRFQDYYNQMKAADPTIKIGIVTAPGEDSYVNGNTTHAATNSFTGQRHYGFTAVVLATLKSLGITPDFAVNHRYPEYTGSGFQPNSPDSDALLLQSTRAWADDAADLRQQIAAYFGPTGTNIELVVTENNSDAGSQGKQSTSLVNGLYLAESLAQLMKTEFNSYVWWDLRNGTDNNGCTDSTLYGWRLFGDIAMVGGLNTRYPSFYTAKLMQSFARPGDTVLTAASDYGLLTAYAARRASGALSLLVVNRDTVTNLNAQIALNGFIPTSVATLRSFGIAQDEATRTNGPAAAKDIATNTFPSAAATFSYNFQPLSLNLLTLAPAAPMLTALPPAVQPPGQFIFQLIGQTGVRYYIQNSANLTTWTTIATNTLSGNTLLLTNSAPPDSAMQFWRAVWLP